MAIDWKKWGILGALSGAGAPYILSFLARLPIVGVQAATTPFVLRIEQEVGVPKAIGEWFLGMTKGLLPTLPQVVTTALIGALAFIVGAYAADYLKQLKGTPRRKITTVIFMASIVPLILGISAGIPTLMTILGLVINAVMLSTIIVFFDSVFKLKLIP